MKALILSVVLGSSVLWGMAGCKRGERMKPVDQAPTPTAAAAPAAPAATPSGRPALTGKVLETMNAGSYTYLKLATAAGVKWAAVMKVAVKVGDQVAVQNPMTMRDFKSKSLGRTWKELVFGTVGGPARPAAAAGAMTGASPHGKMSKGMAGGMMKLKPTGKLNIKIAKAKGAAARTVAEIFAQRASLKSKKVVVRGKVTKFNAQIMGKNWLHLQDGTGTAKAANYDLAVTTQGRAKVGDVVTVSGIVGTDKKLGAGYSYSVLIEKATLTR